MSKMLRLLSLFVALHLLVSPAKADLFLNELSGFGAGGESAFECDAVVFDGTNDYMRRGADLTGNADSKAGIFSAWVKINGGNGGNQMLLSNEGQFFLVRRNTANRFQIQADSGTGTVLDATSATTYTAGATWRHVLISWDLATSTVQIYVTDASDLTGGPTLVNSNIEYTVANWSIGDNVAGSQILNADLAELFFHNTYLDISVEANRRKFISATGKPVDLGSNGSTPLGVQPLVYQSVRPGEAATAFATNRGSGGNFSITGTLTTASTSPSD